MIQKLYEKRINIIIAIILVGLSVCITFNVGAQSNSEIDTLFSANVNLEGWSTLASNEASVCAGDVLQFGLRDEIGALNWDGPNGFSVANKEFINLGVVSLDHAGDFEVSNTENNTKVLRLSVEAAPEITAISKLDGTAMNEGSITFSFLNTPNRTGIEFSLDGGKTWPDEYRTGDHVGSYTISSLPPGFYDVRARWGDNSCPIKLASQTIGSEVAAVQPIILPVEVLGEEGKVVERVFNLSDDEANIAQRLWLQVNNLSYEGKGSVQINSGEWLTLTHESVDMQYQEKARGGMVHGGFNTIRFSIPADDISEGVNTVRFRFNHSDGISNGYRVVRFNLLDRYEDKVLADSRFEEDDPADWVAPYGGNASIEAGQALWDNGSLWNNYLESDKSGFWYAASIDSFQPIKATCSSCHTQDGRDLEIFSYSNESIIERAKFHNMSEEEGKLIATYIRSLSGTHENVDRYGRPWNPPYQPGPELAGKPIEQWAAGAGLDAVLDKDADMLPYLIPGKLSAETVGAYFDSDKMDDRTEIPLAIQLPDWKHWLPIIHPMDAYNKNGFYENEAALDYHPGRAYRDFRDYLVELPKLDDNVTIDFNEVEFEEISDAHGDFWAGFRFFQAQGDPEGIGCHWRCSEGTARSHLADGVSLEMASTSLARFMGVKNFEFMTEFNLQDKAPQYLNPIDQPNNRQWFHSRRAYSVFEAPPHFTGCVINDCQQFQGQPTETGQYESTNWYHLQLVIAGGEGNQSWNQPVDYNYHPEFILNSAKSSGIYEPLRYYHSLNSMYQTKTWSGATNPNDGMGFRIRVQGPWYFLGKEGDAGSSQLAGHAPGFWPTLLDDVTPGLTKLVLDAQIKQFLKEIDKPENSLTTWLRWKPGENGSNRLDPIEKSKVEDVTKPLNSEAPLWADHMYWVIPEAANFGVECELIHKMADWSKAAWPNIGGWDDLKETPVAYINLHMNSETGSIETIAGSPGNNPGYTWWVNDEEVQVTGSTLANSYFADGDTIRVRLASNSTCLTVGRKTAEASLWIEPNLTIESTINSSAVYDKEIRNAELGDVLEVKVGIPQMYPLMWLDAMDVVEGAEPELGAKIDEWQDISGNGMDAIATKSDLEPSYDPQGLNGMPAIVFGNEGNADGLSLFSPDRDDFFEEDWTIFIVGESSGSIDNWGDLIGNRSEGNSGWIFRFSDNGRSQLVGADTSGHGRTQQHPYPFLATITKNDLAFSLHLDGKQDIENEHDVSDLFTNEKAVYLGQGSDGSVNTGRYHKGPISELLIFDRALSQAEREYVEGYLAHKWKLDQNLSNFHRYFECSLLDIDLTMPSGEVINLEQHNYSYKDVLDDPNKFGKYVLQKPECTSQTHTFTLIDPNAPIGNLKYKVLLPLTIR